MATVASSTSPSSRTEMAWLISSVNCSTIIFLSLSHYPTIPDFQLIFPWFAPLLVMLSAALHRKLDHGERFYLMSHFPFFQVSIGKAYIFVKEALVILWPDIAVVYIGPISVIAVFTTSEFLFFQFAKQTEVLGWYGSFHDALYSIPLATINLGLAIVKAVRNALAILFGREVAMRTVESSDGTEASPPSYAMAIRHRKSDIV